MKRLGERIKKKRELQHIQLNDLARRVGISPSALSQIEKAKATPSILTLKHIAVSLNTTVGELIGEFENLSQNPLISKADIKFVEKSNDGTEMFLLSNLEKKKNMETYLLRFVSGSSIDGLFANLKGQVFCHVLSGEFQFFLDEVDYQLLPGDSFYFDTLLSHRVSLHKADAGELLWINA